MPKRDIIDYSGGLPDSDLEIGRLMTFSVDF